MKLTNRHKYFIKTYFTVLFYMCFCHFTWYLWRGEEAYITIECLFKYTITALLLIMVVADSQIYIPD